MDFFKIFEKNFFCILYTYTGICINMYLIVIYVGMAYKPAKSLI